MALTHGPFFAQDLIGTVDTLTLQAADPTTMTQATIANAYYGVDSSNNPIPATVASDALSVTFTILAGVQPLIVNLISPDPQNELVELVQGSFTATEFVVRKHSATTTFLIQGLLPATT